MHIQTESHSKPETQSRTHNLPKEVSKDNYEIVIKKKKKTCCPEIEVNST